MNKFKEQFTAILQDEEIQHYVRLFIEEGKKTNHFSDYFGINYTQDEIVGVKLYFSYFHLPEPSFFSALGLSNETYELIKSQWVITEEYYKLHEGLTFALKINKDKNVRDFQFNFYIYYRSYKIRMRPHKMNVESYKNSKQGISIEWQKGKREKYRNYFYLKGESDVSMIISYFNLNKELLNKIDEIEYTESQSGEKINMILKTTTDVYEYLKTGTNNNILTFSNYLYENYGMYVFAPGVRKDSTVKAIYYVTKARLEERAEEKTLSLIIDVI